MTLPEFIECPVFARMRPVVHACLTTFGYKVDPMIRIGTEKIKVVWAKPPVRSE